MQTFRKNAMKAVVLLTAVTVFLLTVTPVLAVGFGVSPPRVEFDVAADGNTDVEFLVYNFDGNLQVSLEDIPLRVEPMTVPVTAGDEGSKITLTFYGDESLGSQVFEGKIRFLAMSSGNVAVGIKVKATINHIASGQPLPQPEEELPETSETIPSTSPPTPTETTELDIPLLAGIAGGTAIVITLIIVVARRKRY